MADQCRDDLAGLILISGLSPGIAGLSVKTLLITGKGDERFTPGIVKWVLKHEKAQPMLLEHRWLDSDHLLIVKRKAEMQGLIRAWLSAVNVGQVGDGLQE